MPYPTSAGRLAKPTSRSLKTVRRPPGRLGFSPISIFNLHHHLPITPFFVQKFTFCTDSDGLKNVLSHGGNTNACVSMLGVVVPGGGLLQKLHATAKSRRRKTTRATIIHFEPPDRPLTFVESFQAVELPSTVSHPTVRERLVALGAFAAVVGLIDKALSCRAKNPVDTIIIPDDCLGHHPLIQSFSPLTRILMKG